MRYIIATDGFSKDEVARKGFHNCTRSEGHLFRLATVRERKEILSDHPEFNVGFPVKICRECGKVNQSS